MILGAKFHKTHIEAVVSRISKRNPVLVLTGARQVGNSTMLREVYHEINSRHGELYHGDNLIKLTKTTCRRLDAGKGFSGWQQWTPHATRTTVQGIRFTTG